MARCACVSGGILAVALLTVGCATAAVKPKQPSTDVFLKPLKNPTSYEEAGRWWGAKHKVAQLSPGQLDDTLVGGLAHREHLAFFWIHAELKDAFKKGYRIGFEDRTADLVLGPHLTDAAAKIGKATSAAFVQVIKTFEAAWPATLRNAVDVFLVLISEGSQADRENFINLFTQIYEQKYRETEDRIRSGGYERHVSEGGTMLYLDIRKTIAVLAIPKPSDLKSEIYRSTFRAMGDEWGKRFSNNLMKRDDLVDVLRRSKTAFQEEQGGLDSSLCRVRSAFADSYGTDAENVFDALSRDAGYSPRPCNGGTAVSSPTPTPTPAARRRP